MNDPLMTTVVLPVVLALLLPLVGFAPIALIPPFRRLGRAPAVWSMLVSLVVLACAVTAFQQRGLLVEPVLLSWRWLPSHDGTLASIGVLVDHSSVTMLVLVALVSCLVQTYSLAYLHDEPRPALGRYYAWQSLFAFSMMGMVLAPNLLQLFICWEMVGLCSYLLIGFWYQKPAAARAAVKAFWTTKAGDAGLLIGIVLLWAKTGTLDLLQLHQLAAAGLIPLAGLSTITFCLYLGAAGKSAQFPFHIWLPDAMEGPTPVSALIHAATMVTAGVYLLFRTAWLFALTPDVLLIVAWVGAGTALMAAVLACVQTDIKKVLAYSTVSQLGYMMAAIGAGGAEAGFLHLLTHGVFKALLFLAAGAVIHAVGSNELGDMGRLARQLPQTAAVFLIGTLSLAGIPFFAGFLSKEEILAAVWHGHLPVPFAMLVTAAFLTAFYMARVVFLTFFSTSAAAHPALQAGHAGSHGHGHGAPHDPPFLMGAPLWILAALSLWIGITLTLGHAEPGTAEAPAWLSPVAITAALSGIGLAWLTYQRRLIDADRLAAAFGPLRRAAIARFWVDDVLAAGFRVGLLGFAGIMGFVDRYLVDGVLNVVSVATVEAGDRLRRVQTGRVQDYVYSVALGLLVLAVWMGWPK